MAKLRFYYSVMNAGKSVHLLQVNFNYKAQGRDTVLLTHSLDTRSGEGLIASRMGIEAKAVSVSNEFNIFEHVKQLVNDETKDVACVLVDESQFFTRKHIEDLSDVADFLNVPVMCYGLRTSSNGNLFEGSKSLFELADEVEEISQVCFCGSKARMVLKFTQDGRVNKNGKIVDIGAEEKYVSVCRYHWKTIKHIDETKRVKK